MLPAKQCGKPAPEAHVAWETTSCNHLDLARFLRDLSYEGDVTNNT